MQAKGNVKENTQDKTRKDRTVQARGEEREERGVGRESQSMSSHRMVGITNGRLDFDSLACSGHGSSKEVCQESVSREVR